ncbi:MAG TPA: DoxX family protein [Ramlibacter sp.]|uniref:DoxX family protein n=1 Tax=Ramlibacter sp. TaxID=1917967 RepID=UPI002D7F3979|nr:DoxX family protein [Ramlibacter sp.]HET8744117.1 DoxX family protein [Ramlibacter sp.]
MLTLTRDDFRLRAASFDLTNTSNVLRIMVGALMIPHAASKFAAGAINPGTVAFFEKAGIHPAEFMVGFAAASEIAVAIALILGICTRFAGLGAAAILAIASYAVVAVKGFGWTWNTGGIEFNVVWAILGLLVAIDAWKDYARSARPALRAYRPAHA